MKATATSRRVVAWNRPEFCAALASATVAVVAGWNLAAVLDPVVHVPSCLGHGSLGYGLLVLVPGFCLARHRRPGALAAPDRRTIALWAALAVVVLILGAILLGGPRPMRPATQGVFDAIFAVTALTTLFGLRRAIVAAPSRGGGSAGTMLSHTGP